MYSDKTDKSFIFLLIQFQISYGDRVTCNLCLPITKDKQDDSNYKPHFWVREEKQSNAEVDMIFQFGKYIIPIEVKSGKQGSLRSLHQFVERTNHPYAVRFYQGEFSIEETITPNGKSYLLMNLPYYLGTRIHDYAAYLIENHSL